MRDLVIVGAGPHGRETLDIVEAVNSVAPTWNVLGFVDDDGDRWSEFINRRDVAIVGPVAELQTVDAAYVIGIGWPDVRRTLDKLISGWGREPATLIHPLASVASDNLVGPGCVLAAGARVTTSVTIGRHTHLNLNTVVSHDCQLGDHVQISPGAIINGNVTIGSQSFVGSGAIVTPAITIGDAATIGAGAVVTTDVPAGVTAIGVPARW